MASSLQTASAERTGSVEQFDAIIIGAGVTGLYQLYRLRELGLSVRLYDDGSGVGGTWFWNRYPGCRFDSESETYAYSFSEELLQEWEWKEHFSGQPENEKYLNYVADKFNLRPNIQLNSKVVSAVYDEGENLLGDQTRERQAGARKVSRSRGWHPFRELFAQHSRTRHLQGCFVSHLAMAEGDHGLHREARGGDWHGCDRGPANPDNRTTSWSPHGVSADAELLCTVAELVGVGRDTGEFQKELPPISSKSARKPRPPSNMTSIRGRSSR